MKYANFKLFNIYPGKVIFKKMTRRPRFMHQMMCMSKVMRQEEKVIRTL